MAVLTETKHDEVTYVDSSRDGSDTAPNQEAAGEKVTGVEVSQFDMHDDFMDTASEQANGLKTTRQDAQDMARMGKTQVLVRHFRVLSMTSFTALATAAWEFGLFLITPALLNGGSPSLLWSTIWNFFLFGPVFLSVAEMASMAPTAGCQYHWVSEFAPDEYQRILSYIVGWVSTLAWQAGNAASALLVGTLIQVIIQIGDPNYGAPKWQATLLTIAAVAVSYVGNVYGNRALPHWQNAVFGVHILGFFAVIVPIWVNAPRATEGQVWLEFTNNAGWSNMVLTVLVGQVTAIGGYVGLDTTTHMAEEVKHASRTLPVAMISVYLINFIINFSLYVTIAYHLPDLLAALGDVSAYPAIYILRQTMSSGWLIALLSVTVAITLASNIVYLAAVTRDLFAFARDQGLPFSGWLSKVDKNRHMPANACLVSSSIAIALSLIYLGNAVAFYAIAGLYTVALLGCYVTSISCCLWRRIKHPETMPKGHFSLGRWGIPCNAFAIFYSLWSFFWGFWPYTTPFDPSSMNWSAPIFAFTIIWAVAYFFIRGRHNYQGPVVDVQGRKSSLERTTERSGIPMSSTRRS